nr:hypothetical protein CFP56_52208 [Quercus suber]
MEGRPRYFIFPGNVTGDLWHVAAAQILSKTCQYVAAIVISSGLNKNDDWKFARVTYGYLRNIELECILIKIDDPYDKAGFEKTAYTLGEGFFDDAYEKQSKLSDTDRTFDALAPKPPADTQPGPLRLVNIDKPVVLQGGTRLLALMNATNIAVTALDPSNISDRKQLAERLSAAEGKAVDETIKNAAMEKYDELVKLIDGPQIVVENYRVGHVNGRTDSNSSMSEYLYNTVQGCDEKRKVVTIVSVNDEGKWNQLRARKSPAPVLFDLFNKVKREGKTWKWEPAEWPGLDPRAQAYFWAQVAENRNIFGVFGGRSGSLDIAGFCGVTTFFWDEPWIEFGSGKEVFKKTKGQATIAYQQVPQCLRSLQLATFMSIGLPEGKVNEPWSEIREQALQSWLGGTTSGIYPTCPDTAKWQMVSPIPYETASV